MDISSFFLFLKIFYFFFLGSKLSKRTIKNIISTNFYNFLFLDKIIKYYWTMKNQPMTPDYFIVRFRTNDVLNILLDEILYLEIPYLNLDNPSPNLLILFSTNAASCTPAYNLYTGVHFCFWIFFEILK